MRVRNIIENKDYGIGSVWYTYSFGHLYKSILKGVCRDDHAALFYDTGCNESFYANGSQDFYETPEAAMKGRMKQIEKQMRLLKQELEIIKKKIIK